MSYFLRRRRTFRVRVLPPGVGVFEENTFSSTGYLIIRGAVHLLKDERIFHVAHPGDLLGSHGLYGASSDTDITLRTASGEDGTECVIAPIPSERLEQWFRIDERATRTLLRGIALNWERGMENRIDWGDIKKGIERRLGTLNVTLSPRGQPADELAAAGKVAR